LEGGGTRADLRDAHASDVPRLTALVEAAYRPWIERIDAIPRPMKDDYAEVVRTRRVTVAERGGEIVGLIVLDVSEGTFLIENVAVDPEHRGTGIGRTLLEHAERAALDEGHSTVYLYTNEHMTENLELYERIGYVEYDRRRVGAAGVVYLRKELR
jgi:ribosomal protein S18 acetylase RimI-like enzyme